jgi:hypothetical protein
LGTRHSPRPLWGGHFMHDSGASRRGIADAHLKFVATSLREAKRRSNPFSLLSSLWIAWLRSQ